MEHSGRTCCTPEDVLPIRQQMSAVKYYSEPKINEKCFTLTSKMMCSKCDADIGTGLNSNNAICSDICEQWFYSCGHELLDPYVDKKEAMPFCREDSMVCSRVIDTFRSSAEYCKYMGYNVID